MSESDQQRADKASESLTYLTNIANAFDPVEGDVHFDPTTWSRIRNAIYDLTPRSAGTASTTLPAEVIELLNQWAGMSSTPHWQWVLGMQAKTKSVLLSVQSATERTVEEDAELVTWAMGQLEQVGVLRHYDSAKELPNGGWAVYNGGSCLGFGGTVKDAIRDALAKATMGVPDSRANNA